jgi:hypothetical protein
MVREEKASFYVLVTVGEHLKSQIGSLPASNGGSRLYTAGIYLSVFLFKISLPKNNYLYFTINSEF